MALTEADLAYMRSTQAEYRPTEALLSRRTSTRSPSGGSSDAWGEGQPVSVRVAGAVDRVPQELAERYGLAGLARITMDLVPDVRAGDRITVSTDPATAESYEVVSDGQPDEWATAQQVWAHRLTYPAR